MSPSDRAADDRPANDGIGAFLATRRARLGPDDAGLPTYGERRRVPGLRREEVALLAGVSVEYYTRIERGRAGVVSDDVIDGIARALQLDEAEHGHLIDLLRGGTRPARRRPPRLRIRPEVQRLVESIGDAPAVVRNGRLDLLAANPLGRALYSPLYDEVAPGEVPNLARFQFLSDQAPAFYPNWDAAAHTCVALLRSEAGRDPYDRALGELVAELSEASEEFRVRWGEHHVVSHRTGRKHAHHPVVGELSLGFESLSLDADPGQTLLIYTAEPNSPSAEALRILASWSLSTSDEVTSEPEAP